MKKIVIFILVIFSLISCRQEVRPDLELETVDDKKIENSYELAVTWLKNNFRSKWIFTYIYEPTTWEMPSKNNTIRQFLASRIIAELSHEDQLLKQFHQKNLEFIFRNWYREDGEYGYVYYSKKSKLWANALLLRVLISSPFFQLYKDQAYKLANTLQAAQNDDGGFRAWHIEPDYEYDQDYLLTFYSGEALVSLVEFYEKTWEKKYLKIAENSARHYIDVYVKNIEENYYPAYVPWHTMAYNKLYKITRDPIYTQSIFTLNDRLLEIQNKEKTSKYYGRFYHPDFPEYGTPHSSSDEIYTEGLLYALEIAKMQGDEARILHYNQAIYRSYANLFELQYTHSNLKGYTPWEKILWALRYHEDRDTIRIDTVAHYIDATMKYREIYYGRK